VAELAQDDLEALKQAKVLLENPGFTARLADLVGTPLEQGFKALPRAASARIGEVVSSALNQCLRAALATMPSQPAVRHAPWNKAHKLATAVTGGVGGFFGLAALPVELPFTTTVMFRSVCEIARNEGEDLASITGRLQCLSVFAMGGGPKAQGAETGYFAVRAALATEMKAALDTVARGGTAASESLLVRFIAAVASRFSVQVTEQMAAKAIPVVGAVLGATINVLFMDHFQSMAQGHFTVRRLERAYGADKVRAAYEAL
jgi:hypothetical protein